MARIIISLALALLIGVKSEQPVITFEGHGSFIESCIFVDNGKLLVSVSIETNDPAHTTDNTLKTWRLDKKKLVKDVSWSADSHISSVCIVPGGRYLLAGDENLWIYDAASGDKNNMLGGDGSPIVSIAASRDEIHAVTGSHDGTLTIWNYATGSKTKEIKLEAPINVIRYSPDEHYFACGTADGLVAVYDSYAGRLVNELWEHDMDVFALAFSPNGDTIATAGWDRKVNLWQISGQHLISSESVHQKAIFSLDYSPSGRHLASASADHHIKLWGMGEKMQLLKDWTGHDAPVLSTRFSPDGKSVASGGGDKKLMLWNAGL